MLTSSEITMCEQKDRIIELKREIDDLSRSLSEKEEKLNYAVDIYPYYSSDGTAALRAGNDIKCALIGPGIHASHGMERTHYNSLLNTYKLIMRYIKG